MKYFFRAFLITFVILTAIYGLVLLAHAEDLDQPLNEVVYENNFPGDEIPIENVDNVAETTIDDVAAIRLYLEICVYYLFPLVCASIIVYLFLRSIYRNYFNF